MYERYIDMFLSGEDLDGAKNLVEESDIDKLF
jgi:hypothetical protein